MILFKILFFNFKMKLEKTSLNYIALISVRYKP